MSAAIAVNICGDTLSTEQQVLQTSNRSTSSELNIKCGSTNSHSASSRPSDSTGPPGSIRASDSIRPSDPTGPNGLSERSVQSASSGSPGQFAISNRFAVSRYSFTEPSFDSKASGPAKYMHNKLSNGWCSISVSTNTENKPICLSISEGENRLIYFQLHPRPKNLQLFALSPSLGLKWSDDAGRSHRAQVKLKDESAFHALTEQLQSKGIELVWPASRIKDSLPASPCTPTETASPEQSSGPSSGKLTSIDLMNPKPQSEHEDRSEKRNDQSRQYASAESKIDVPKSQNIFPNSSSSQLPSASSQHTSIKQSSSSQMAPLQPELLEPQIAQNVMQTQREISSRASEIKDSQSQQSTSTPLSKDSAIEQNLQFAKITDDIIQWESQMAESSANVFDRMTDPLMGNATQVFMPAETETGIAATSIEEHIFPSKASAQNAQCQYENMNHSVKRPRPDSYFSEFQQMPAGIFDSSQWPNYYTNSKLLEAQPNSYSNFNDVLSYQPTFSFDAMKSALVRGFKSREGSANSIEQKIATLCMDDEVWRLCQVLEDHLDNVRRAEL